MMGISCATATVTLAQTYLPPVFGSDTLNMRPDKISQLYIAPRRIVWTSGETQVKNPNVLLKLSDGQSEMSRVNTCLLRSEGQDTASILFDYGRELHGGLKLVLSASNKREPSAVRIRFGESVGEACSSVKYGTDEKGYATNDHAMRDFILDIPRNGQIEIGNTGFRFIRIDLLQTGVDVRIKEASAILRYRDIPYTGSFRCNDERLNQIWMTGAYTVHLNMQEYLWDGIKRDRLIWLGDMHPEVATIMTVFGENEIVPESIDLACKQFPLPKWLNNMSAYSMWYLILQYEWYLYSGNLAYLRQHRDYITGLIDRIDECVDKDGKEHLSPSRFLDWPSSPNKAGVEAGYRALLCWSLDDAEKLCTVLGEKDYAAKSRDIAHRIRKINKPHNQLKQAAALMSIAGMMDAKKACEEVVSVGGAKDFSTFYGYYMLDALAKGERHQQAIDIIRQYWGKMLDLGATTFWEDFNLDWARNAGRIDEFTPAGKDDIHRDFGAYCYPSFRHSFCHGWASGPTPWMTRYILGIEVLEPGCKTIRITPHLCDLDWAEGTFPTPLGTIYVKHVKQANGKIDTTIKAPKGITIKK